VVQELLRHGNPTITMWDYVQAIPENLGRAQAKLVAGPLGAGENPPRRLFRLNVPLLCPCLEGRRRATPLERGGDDGLEPAASAGTVSARASYQRLTFSRGLPSR
jgi:hypothetical protein